MFGEVSTGTSDDLQKVTSIARVIVMRYRTHEGLGNVVYEQGRPSFPGDAGLRLQERSEPDLKVLRKALQLGAAAGPPVVIGVAANGPHGPVAVAPHA